LQQKVQSLLDASGGRVRRLEVIEGPSGRRNWPDEVKARIVAETLEPGASVACVAARHRVTAQQVTTWRRLAREGRLVLPAKEGALFAPLMIGAQPPAAVPEVSSSASAPARRWIEIVVGAATVRVAEETPAARIAAIAARLAR
jgi:transposase